LINPNPPQANIQLVSKLFKYNCFYIASVSDHRSNQSINKSDSR